MAEQAEQAFAKTFLNTLSTQPIAYGDDYQQPLQNSLKKVPILQASAQFFIIPVPPAPERKQPEASTSSAASISLVFKSLKPPATFTLSIQPTDTIAAIKDQLAKEPTAPPPDAYRLLLKGKALADAKLLKEYSVKDGDTVNLMIKPGTDWDPSKPKATMTSSSPSLAPSSAEKQPSPSTLEPVQPKPTRHRHQRIPSVVLSPSPELSGVVEKDVVLTLDSGAMSSPVIQPETLSTYHTTVSKPEFWQRLYESIKSEFATEADAHQAFEDFLRATKGSLTANEIAKIRDHVGIIGMAGN
ncbi:hypothetical protein BDQ17DRAFT_1406288 [Cyathus striatus]|nr:hypothetical protein BDQ17DRAFT_1406288 [Cyathus striatus]